MANPIPDGMTGATPMLTVDNAAAALDFYQRAFGANVVMRLDDPRGKIGHAEFVIGEALIMISDVSEGYSHSPQTLGGTPVLIHLYVEDVDTFASRAVAEGAEIVIPINDQFYGDRSGRLRDPFGFLWVIATHIEDVPEVEMQRRLNEMFGGQ